LAFEELVKYKKGLNCNAIFLKIDSNMIKVNKDLTMGKVHDEYKLNLQNVHTTFY